MTARPSPRPVSLPTRSAAAGGAWQLLAPGDEVSIAGSGAYEIVYLSEGRAWLSGLHDGAQRLADMASLRLRRAALAVGSAAGRH